MKSQIKLNSEHFFEFATLEINSIWRMQYFFSDTAYIQQYANSITSTLATLEINSIWRMQYFFSDTA